MEANENVTISIMHFKETPSPGWPGVDAVCEALCAKK